MPIKAKKSKRRAGQTDPCEARPGTRSVGEQIARQLNEIVLDIRKSFGMFGRTNWAVDQVDPDVITVRFYHWPTSVSVIYAATNVRNAMLNLLRDTVPCARFHAVFCKPDRSRAYRRVDLDFYPPEATDLPSQLIVIEENVEPQRQHWRALVDRAAGSAAYFRCTRREGTT